MTRSTTREILVVEDDQWFSDLLADEIRQIAGYQVKVVADAPTAMGQIDRQPPDAIVLDYYLPGVNGLVLLHELQTYGDTAGIPVIICSNSCEVLYELESNLRHYGVRAIVDKSVMQPGDISGALKGVLA